jgi:N-acetylglucosaminyldiphosphoundecaprenol N-acetyl-beta-D-mannosaminyltransferase
MILPKTAALLSFPISKGRYEDFIHSIIDLAEAKTSSSICVANVHMVVSAFRNKQFSSVVENAEIVTPDGMPLTWAMKFLYGGRYQRVAGMDLLPDLLQQASEKKLPVFFYGGTDEMLHQTASYLKQNFPPLLVAGMYSPPFRVITKQEEEDIVETINNSSAKIVFVVLGCPKQELWMEQMKGKLQTVMIGIGGALPVMIGMQKRAPNWMQQSGLEWFYRLCQEPRRLFKRYAVTNSLFLLLVFQKFVRIRLFKIQST